MGKPVNALPEKPAAYISVSRAIAVGPAGGKALFTCMPMYEYCESDKTTSIH